MQKDFDEWNRRKKTINNVTGLTYIGEREIWWCSIGLNIGSEQDGRNEDFERPVLVLKRFNNSMVLGVPLTSKTKNNPYYYCFSVRSVSFVAILSQLRLLSTNRFTRRMVKIEQSLFEEIRRRIKEVVL